MHRVLWEQRGGASNPDLAAKKGSTSKAPIRLESLEQDLISLVHLNIPRT